MKPWGLTSVVVCFVLVGFLSRGEAQPVPKQDGLQVEGSGTIVEDTNDPTYRIGKQLRCPVCQGMPIAESPAEMAQTMMARVRELHAEGKTQDEIIAYFVERYGEWVLLKPKTQGINWLVWLLPPFALLFGVLSMGRYRKRREKPAIQSRTQEPTGDAYLQAIRD